MAVSNTLNIDGFLNPDAVVQIDGYLNYDRKKKYDIFISTLCDQVKECVKKNIMTPHIQLKDEEKNLIFNDRLQIETNVPKEYFVNDKINLKVDYIDSGKFTNKIFSNVKVLMNRPFCQNFAIINFFKPLTEISNKEYRKSLNSTIINCADAILEQSLNLKDEHFNITIHSSFLIHFFDEAAKTWVIKSPTKDLEK